MTLEALEESLRGVDIYLLDQILRGRVPTDARVLDAGCGRGRNLRYFLLRGHDVCGVDDDPTAIETVRSLARDLGVRDLEHRFRVERVEDLSFEATSFELVISNAVLHFAKDEGHFDAMVNALHRVAAPGGIVFVRLATTIGVEAGVVPLESPHAARWHRLPDGSDRFLADRELILRTTDRLGARLLDPLKTVVVDGMRAMSTWVWQRA